MDNIINIQKLNQIKGATKWFKNNHHIKIDGPGWLQLNNSMKIFLIVEYLIKEHEYICWVQPSVMSKGKDECYGHLDTPLGNYNLNSNLIGYMECLKLGVETSLGFLCE